jgi:type IV pilus assembly protein PilQ
MVLGMPTISTRQMKTSVLVKNGQTIVLGGIFEINKENGEQGFPFIDRIPLLSFLFKQKNIHENKRELLIFVTPKMVQDA